MSRAKFYYAHGTAYIFRWLGVPVSLDIGGQFQFADTAPDLPRPAFQLAGLNGQLYGWSGGVPADPFPDMVDRNLYDVQRINYPAAFFPIGASIDFGVAQAVERIDDLPVGTPFALGGYSQGAAVMAGVWNEINGGALSSRYNDFLGAVTFGNPRRKVDYRGPIGGTWSGQMGVPGSNSGGGGSFPATGPWARMTDPPDTWVDFTAPDDVFSSIGPTTLGSAWRSLNDFALDLNLFDLAGQLLGGLGDELAAAFQYFFVEQGTAVNYFRDAIGQLANYGGNGHTIYPFLPPPNADGSYNVTVTTSGGQDYLAPVGDTCYQLALRYLNGLAGDWAVAPILPPTPAAVEAGWQTTLQPVPSPTLSAGWSTAI